MKKLAITGILLLSCISVFSQNTVDEILKEVAVNNTKLAAIKNQMEAKKVEIKTENHLQNPEVEFNYLWGKPTEFGNRTDFSLMQSFDFPTTYGFRNQISDLKTKQLPFEFQKQLNEILLQASLLCVDLTYKNTLISELTERLDHAQQLAYAYRMKFESGETNILEYNKAQLNLLSSKKELELIEIERDELLMELALLNGGKPIDFIATEYEISKLPSEFEKWYLEAEKNNPILAWLKQEIEINQTRIKLSKANTLPKFQAGYMIEETVGERFQGISVGMSIPLWENKHRVKLAQANVLAIGSIEHDTKVQFYNRLKAIHKKATSLQNNLSDYKQHMEEFNNRELLKKALESGEISLINYLLDLSIYYGNTDKLLVLEKEYYKTISHLKQYQ